MLVPIQRLLVYAGFLLTLTACVMSPHNDQWVSVHNPIIFWGYANSPDATVEIQALNVSTDTWDTIRTTTASSIPIDVDGDDLYEWRTEVLFVDIPDYECYWGFGTYCSISASLAIAKVRVMQDGEYFMVTFEDNVFAECLHDKLLSLVGGYIAGYECRSEESPVITLKMLT